MNPPKKTVIPKMFVKFIKLSMVHETSHNSPANLVCLDKMQMYAYCEEREIGAFIQILHI
jgi:hypothetical protein